MSFVSRVAAFALAALALGLSGPQASADNYPSKSVRIIVPFGPGGPADIYARLVAQHLSTALKQVFIIENRPGAAALIGTEAAAKAAPDGYTLLMMSNTHTTNESLVPTKSYQLMRDFTAVAGVNSSDLVLVVHPSVPARNVAELIALAKKEPGKLNFASSGQGSAYHMAPELFKKMTGTNMIHIPHKSSAEARNSVIGGHVHLMFDAITTMAPNVEAGQVIALGTSGAKRSSILPNVPSIAEAGVAGYEATVWVGFMAPVGTPPNIVNLLNAAINKILVMPEVAEAWAKQGAVPLVMTPAEFDVFLRKDIDGWAQVVNSAGFRAQQQ